MKMVPDTIGNSDEYEQRFCPDCTHGWWLSKGEKSFLIGAFRFRVAVPNAAPLDGNSHRSGSKVRCRKTPTTNPPASEDVTALRRQISLLETALKNRAGVGKAGVGTRSVGRNEARGRGIAGSRRIVILARRLAALLVSCCMAISAGEVRAAVLESHTDHFLREVNVSKDIPIPDPHTVRVDFPWRGQFDASAATTPAIVVTSCVMLPAAGKM